MDEYISKGNAIFAVSALPLTLDAETTQRAIEAVRHVPAADVVEVVRCRDCKWYHYGHCTRLINTIESSFIFNGPMEYCSYGERKEGEE